MLTSLSLALLGLAGPSLLRVPRLRCCPRACGARLLLRDELEPRDELKSRFARAGPDSETKTSFVPAAAQEDARDGAAPSPQAEVNKALLAEIRALQPEPVEPAPERKPVDLNGIKPENLLLGAASYAAVSVLAWNFVTSSAEFFEAHPMDSAFYVVARLSAVVRVVVVAVAALGAGVTAIAATGQLVLAGRVFMGVASGELDPNAERDDPYAGRKQSELEKMWKLMQGDKRAGEAKDDRM